MREASLSGQAQTDGLLVDVRRGFRDVEVLDGGKRVRCRPGATIRMVNAYLAPYKRALGPDPASETACTVGGVVANNSSGMQCGTEFNTYKTLESLEILLPSGTFIDSGAPDADEKLRALEPDLYAGLLRLRDRIRNNPDSVRRIKHQFSMKNTMGYGVNSFLDYDTPIDILVHLLVGSEGTLAFIASATFRTVPVLPEVSTALLVFDSIDSATRALPDLISAGTATAELMDAASLKVAQNLPSSGAMLAGLEVAAHTALLVEAQADTPEQLAAKVSALGAVVRDAAGLTDQDRAAGAGMFSTDAARRAQAWSVRKGLYTAVAGARPLGSTALLEDVVVPAPALSGTVAHLQELCVQYGYDDFVIFGHAKDANMHFMINPDLRDPRALDTYAEFTEDLVDLILGADGSLKAEHGTGRIMAPYVHRQYGDELYAVMRELKELCDPKGILNPGSIIGDDPNAHLVDLKVSDPVDPAVDACVECGYCEPVCPSRDITTTPRQRIALLRELNQADPQRREEIAEHFDYMAVDTCAADSLCLLNCPVGIDTGKVMKKLRAERMGPKAQALGEVLAKRWGGTTNTLRVGVRMAQVVPSPVLGAITRMARRILPTDIMPEVGGDLPRAGISRATTSRSTPGDVVLLPSCLGEMFGGFNEKKVDGDPLVDAPEAQFAFLAVCDAAGVKVRIPDGVDSLCCGTVWRSKGLVDGAAAMARRTGVAILEASQEGRVPVVSESSSCTNGLASLAADLRGTGLPEDERLAERLEKLTIMDATAFVAREVLQRLNVQPRWDRAVVHPTCSDRHSGSIAHLRTIAKAVAREVVEPVEAGCCGFAGDRGMLHPELTAAATAREARQAREADGDVYLSTNRTCEMGMIRATDRPYHHVLSALYVVLQG